jgi:hypothetical protein
VFIVFSSMTSFIWAIRGKVSKAIPTIFQLYREGQFYFLGETGLPEENHRSLAIKSLTNLIT